MSLYLSHSRKVKVSQQQRTLQRSPNTQITEYNFKCTGETMIISNLRYWQNNEPPPKFEKIIFSMQLLTNVGMHMQTHTDTHSSFTVNIPVEVIGSTGVPSPAHRLCGRISSSSFIKTLIAVDYLITGTCLFRSVMTLVG